MSADDEERDRVPDLEEQGADDQPQPWAKASASTESLAADDDEDDIDEGDEDDED